MPNDWWNVFGSRILCDLFDSAPLVQGKPFNVQPLFKHSGLIGWYWEVSLIFPKQTTMQNRLSAWTSNFQSCWTPWYKKYVHRHCNWETFPKIMDGSKFKQTLPGNSPGNSGSSTPLCIAWRFWCFFVVLLRKKPNWLSVQHSVKRFTLSHLYANLKLPRTIHGNSAKMPWYFLKKTATNQTKRFLENALPTAASTITTIMFVMSGRIVFPMATPRLCTDPMKDYLFWMIQFSCQQAMYLRRDTVFVGWLWHNSMYKFQCWSVSNVLEVIVPIQFQCLFFGGLRRISRIIFIVHYNNHWSFGRISRTLFPDVPHNEVSWCFHIFPGNLFWQFQPNSRNPLKFLQQSSPTSRSPHQHISFDTKRNIEWTKLPQILQTCLTIRDSSLQGPLPPWMESIICENDIYLRGRVLSIQYINAVLSNIFFLTNQNSHPSDTKNELTTEMWTLMAKRRR